jgi:predicted component of type VI protein secretion system
MGDSGEGLVDAESRIQERMEEREADRRRSSGQAPVADPDKAREKESLKLARAELTRQASATTHPVRKKQIDAAIAEIDKRLTT